MASFLERLQAAAMEEDAQFNIFLAEYLPTATTVFAFVEGRDDVPFYAAHVERRLADGFSFRVYRCGNKRGVLDAFAEYRRRFLGVDPRVVFLVDKDHEDLVSGTASPQDPSVRVTSTYAIENVLCTTPVLRRLLVELAGLEPADPALDVICETVDESAARFAEAVRPVMAWCVACRRRGKNPPLNNLRLSDFVHLSEQLACCAATAGDEPVPERLSRAVGLALVPPVEEVEAVDRELRQLPPKGWIRGKFEAWWFVRAYNIALDGLRQARAAGGAPKPHTTLSESNFVELAASRADTPADLLHWVAQRNQALRAWASRA